MAISSTDIKSLLLLICLSISVIFVLLDSADILTSKEKYATYQENNTDEFKLINADINSMSMKNSTLYEESQNSEMKPKVMCMIFTMIANWGTRGLAVANTWATRCHFKEFFYSTEKNQSIPGAIALHVPEGRKHLTQKTWAALKYSYNKYSEKVDWFLKADDDIYLVWENLLWQLSKFNSSQPKYVGRILHSTNHIKAVYNSGGAGYLLSKPAVSAILAMPESTCHRNNTYEDEDIGDCLAKAGVTAEHTLDQDQRLTFNSDSPLRLMEGKDHRLNRDYFVKRGVVQFGNPKAIDKMLSPDTVSFHYVRPEEIYMFDFLLYDLKRHGEY